MGAPNLRGNGTVNRLAYYNLIDSLAPVSELFTDGFVLGIGEPAPSALLHVNSNDAGVAQIIDASGGDGDAEGLIIDAINGSALSIGLQVSASGAPTNIAADFVSGNVLISDTLFLLSDLQIPTNAAAGRFLTSDAFGNAAWTTVDTQGVFEKVGGVIRDTTSTYDSDFVIGSPQLDDDANVAHDSRMFFDKSLGLFV